MGRIWGLSQREKAAGGLGEKEDKREGRGQGETHPVRNPQKWSRSLEEWGPALLPGFVLSLGPPIPGEVGLAACAAERGPLATWDRAEGQRRGRGGGQTSDPSPGKAARRKCPRPSPPPALPAETRSPSSRLPVYGPA